MIKDWIRQNVDDAIYFERKGEKEKKLVILPRTIHTSYNFPKIFKNAPKNHKYCITGTFNFSPFDTFKTKKDALKFAKSWMRKH